MELRDDIAKCLTPTEQQDLLNSLAHLQQGDGESGYRGRMAKYILTKPLPDGPEGD